MDSYKKQRRKFFKLLLDLGVLMTLLCVNRAHLTRNSEFSLPSRQSKKCKCIQVIVKKILPIALGNINGPWATFYILLSWPF